MFEYDMVEDTTTFTVGKFSITTPGYLDTRSKARFIGKILDKNKQSADSEAKFPTAILKAAMKHMIAEANQIIIDEKEGLASSETELRTLQLSNHRKVIQERINSILAIRGRRYDNIVDNKLLVTYFESRLRAC